MRVLVTRPAAQAQDWVTRLRARGIDAHALPLIEIADAADPAPLHDAWRSMPATRLVIFVSPNAAERFFAARLQGASWPTATQAAAPGPGTTQTLLGLGVPRASIVEPAADAAQFDSAALWAQLAGRDWQDAPVLCVRGDGGRDWLVERLREAGAQVTMVCAYQRVMPVLDAQAQQLLAAALSAPAHTLWWFSSSQAIDHLAALAPAGADWPAARTLVTHPRIAARARALGFGHVDETRPASDEVLSAIERSIQSTAL
jgi:uroporphyrinogen-III synthase